MIRHIDPLNFNRIKSQKLRQLMWNIKYAADVVAYSKIGAFLDKRWWKQLERGQNA
jgi:hypothetical protein